MRSLLARVVVTASIIAGCSEPTPPEPFPIIVKVESDPGKPVAGVGLARANQPLGATSTDGRAMVMLAGVEGEIADVTVTCPAGFLAPPRPLSVRLMRFAEKSKVPEYAMQCVPSTRRVVVVIRAENGPNLPVVYLERLVTRTDASGAASVALEVPPGAQFIIGLDTRERPDLTPINPQKLFIVGNQDDVLLFDQRFEVDKTRYTPPPAMNIPRAL